MRRFVAALALLTLAQAAQAAGLLIPVEKKLPPLAMLNHHVQVSIEEQVAITSIEQTFRNHTDRQLEATYIFPVPKGASVRDFAMWVDGTKVKGELVEADKARKIYTDIVSRTQDPGLLEYMGNNLLKLRVFPVPPKGDQKIAISYTSIADSDNGLIEYRYPLKTDAKAPSTLDKFTLKVSLKSQHALQSIYSPSHAITMQRPNDKEAVIGFEKDQAVLDKDFQLFYTSSAKDIGLTALAHRPSPGQNGYFLMLIAPRLELSKSQQVPRDMVFVMDTSGSMRGKRMKQAQEALNYCLSQLTQTDRFAVLNFATTVNRYSESLQTAGADTVAAARKWVDALEASGGTAIDDALAAALALRPNDPARTFTIVFFTDGRPTIGETSPEKIVQNVGKRNSASTRIFTFGVGDDVNAAMLDQIAEHTRSISTYVREAEAIEAKVSSLYGKISNPVLANLKLSVGEGVKISEVYPPQLPDLFHGSQLTVLGRYSGKGHAAVKLAGSIGMETKEFVYELNFADKTEDKAFVEDLWARRKVGYMLDQIRVNGEKKELVDEVVALAKRYGITTPYTSYLVVPDQPIPAVRRPGPDGKPNVGFAPAAQPRALGGAGGFGGAASAPLKVEDFARQVKGQASGKELGDARGKLEADLLKKDAKDLAERPAATSSPEEKKAAETAAKSLNAALDQQRTFDRARDEIRRRNLREVQEGQLGVDLAVQMNQLRNQERFTRTANRNVQSRNLLDLGGVWIDDAFDVKMPSVTIKAQSAAYFKLLERHPKMREVLQLGNWIVWVTPSGTALIIDRGAGEEQMTNEAIDRLFVAPMKK
ncbi:MAG: VIT and VWA domain-containing protein [Gemmataceae bacterium]|nr:VIT and VWA domain-containing protein [Gemmataceae bacterium]